MNHLGTKMHSIMLSLGTNVKLLKGCRPSDGFCPCFSESQVMSLCKYSADSEPEWFREPRQTSGYALATDTIATMAKSTRCFSLINATSELTASQQDYFSNCVRLNQTMVGVVSQCKQHLPAKRTICTRKQSRHHVIIIAD